MAGDLLGSAFALGDPERAGRALEIITSAGNLPKALDDLRNGLVAGNVRLDSPPPEFSRLARYSRIQRLKRHLRHWPGDALAAIDLAREYAILGQRESARRPITMALALAPNHSLILRSAVRFYLNLDEPDRALALIRRAVRLTKDPWLLAAEIAVSGAMEVGPRHARAAREMLASGRFAPHHLSELGAALGTIEIEAGNRRSARRLFSGALTDPTENSVAQHEWVTIELDNLGIEVPAHESPARLYEAHALGSIAEGNWTAALDHAKDWHNDEPFSTRAAYFGSWASSVVCADHSLALEFAAAGLDTKPADFMLLNNKAVALALLDRVEEARDALKLIDSEAAKTRSEATYLATSGLIEFRSGRVLEGRILYQGAREVAARLKNHREEAWLLLFHAREEGRVDKDSGLKLLAEADSPIQKLRARDQRVALRLREIVSTEIGGDATRPAASGVNNASPGPGSPR